MKLRDKRARRGGTLHVSCAHSGKGVGARDVDSMHAQCEDELPEDERLSRCTLDLRLCLGRVLNRLLQIWLSIRVDRKYDFPQIRVHT